MTSTRRLPLSSSFYFHFCLYPSQPLESASCRPQSWWLSLLPSVCHSIRSSEVDTNDVCYAFVQPCSFGRSLSISVTRHQPRLHAIRNLFVFVEYCHLLELYVKCAALYRTFIARLEYAMWSSARETIPSDPVAGRVRGMVVGQWSYKQKTLSVTRNMVV